MNVTQGSKKKRKKRRGSITDDAFSIEIELELVGITGQVR